ncbi:methyltransferase domain-containing protein [candidate division KSB1 bacterium]|nr:methyltransferase domain-containing protein [candidate division KSB1 bacterium]NIV71083.1 methyltransferase domain-containing protein [Phycisphaerae bacterium]NIR72362.1 methyltransferase domain-containing protein [candidate division KSB1 bacterium]NIS28365.1 methyltransferase domain-containing protein [candidate division KSB1 bacterium]NIT75246.1 methyltransferase domain-containing protein [candidate division KSB1 bacterium]
MQQEKGTISQKKTQHAHMELVEGYFDTHSKYWSDAYLRPRYVNDFVLIARNRIAVDFLCSYLRPQATVLDAGCGAGLTTMALVEKGFFVHGVDISQRMLDLCEQNLSEKDILPSRYLLTQADLLQAELRENSFDGIVALGFLQYQMDEHRALLALNKLLQPGGILVVSGPVKVKLSNYFGLGTIYYAVKNSLQKLQNNGELAVLHQISTHYYSLGRFRGLLRQAGFQLLDYKGHGFVNFAIIRDWTSRGQHFLHRFFTRLSKFLPIERFGNDMVVVARKQEEK